MRKSAEICKLPEPVVAVIRDEGGRVTFKFAPTLYQAQQAALKAGATEISLTPWEGLNLELD